MSEQTSDAPNQPSTTLMGRLSIGQKIMAVVGLSVLSVIAVGAVSVMNMAKIGHEIEQIAGISQSISSNRRSCLSAASGSPSLVT